MPGRTRAKDTIYCGLGPCLCYIMLILQCETEELLKLYTMNVSQCYAGGLFDNNNRRVPASSSSSPSAYWRMDYTSTVYFTRHLFSFNVCLSLGLRLRRREACSERTYLMQYNEPLALVVCTLMYALTVPISTNVGCRYVPSTKTSKDRT
ncbi:hypothetical protein F5B17DRAFT_36379 [Nemania serpens]|nr:hypothetical protein F5B17DRAFT_36379 [Nemania serpens]